MSFPHEEIESDGTTLPSYLEPRSPRRALEMVLTEPAHAVPGQHWRATQLAVCNRTLRREGLQVWMDLMPEGDIYFGLMVQVHLFLAIPSCSLTILCHEALNPPPRKPKPRTLNPDPCLEVHG